MGSKGRKTSLLKEKNLLFVHAVLHRLWHVGACRDNPLEKAAGAFSFRALS